MCTSLSRDFTPDKFFLTIVCTFCSGRLDSHQLGIEFPGGLRRRIPQLGKCRPRCAFDCFRLGDRLGCHDSKRLATLPFACDPTLRTDQRRRSISKPANESMPSRPTADRGRYDAVTAANSIPVWWLSPVLLRTKSVCPYHDENGYRRRRAPELPERFACRV